MVDGKVGVQTQTQPCVFHLPRTVILLTCFFCCTIGLSSLAQKPGISPMEKEYTMLCLGDSYTIGERVAEEDRFPNQAVLQLHLKGIFFEKPRIIATTGWTTDELKEAISREDIHEKYDVVTLLIGVNNQYRGRSAEDYRKEFVELLQQSIAFSRHGEKQVIVLSIPDWGATPFAEGRDREKVAAEIDQFNAINKEESLNHQVNYIDVTPISRKGLNDSSLLTDDGLHPSAKMYTAWTALLEQVLLTFLK